MKISKSILCMLLIAATLPGSSAAVYAEAKETITYDYYFETDDPDNISYSADKKEIKKDGKYYRLKDITCDIYSEPIEVTEKVKSKDKKVKKYITKEIEGEKFKLYAPGEIVWQDISEKKEEDIESITREYKTTDEVPGTLEQGGRQFHLVSAKPGSRKDKVQTTAVFYSYQKDGDEYEFNGKMVVLDNVDDPKWSGYKKDYADYLGLSKKNDYTITDTEWADKPKKKGGKYIRHAKVYGQKTINFVTAVYTSGSTSSDGEDDADKKYAAEITYRSKYIAHAAVTYERYMPLKQKLIYAGVGLAMLSVLTALILFVLKHKRKQDEEDIELV